MVPWCRQLERARADATGRHRVLRPRRAARGRALRVRPRAPPLGRERHGDVRGTLYPLLARLRREGLVESTWRESTSGPPRRYYRPTPAGEVAFDSFRVEWRRFRDGVDQLLGGQDG